MEGGFFGGSGGGLNGDLYGGGNGGGFNGDFYNGGNIDGGNGDVGNGDFYCVLNLIGLIGGSFGGG